MNPLEFDWDESQQVTVTNPTDKDYRFQVHSKDYEMKAGETAKMPGFIAWAYVYGLATRMAQETNVVKDENGGKTSDFQHWNEEGFRQQYYDKIVVGADALIEKVTIEPEIEFEKVEVEETSAPSQSKQPKTGRKPRKKPVAGAVKPMQPKQQPAQA